MIFGRPFGKITNLPEDILWENIIPRFSSTDLSLLIHTVPQFKPIIDFYLYKRHHEQAGAIPRINRTIAVTNQIVPPAISRTARYMVTSDAIEKTLILNDIKSDQVVAETKHPRLQSIVTMAFGETNDSLVVILEDSFEIYEFPSSTTGQLTGPFRKVQCVQFDVAASVDACPKPGSPRFDSGTIIISSSKGHVNVAAHVLTGALGEEKAIKIAIARMKADTTGNLKQLSPTYGRFEPQQLERSVKFEENESPIMAYEEDGLYKWSKTGEGVDVIVTGTMNTIWLKCLTMFSFTGDIELVGTPTRLFIPPSVLGEDAFLINASTEYCGPWSVKFVHDCPEQGVLLSSSVSPCQAFLNVVRERKGIEGTNLTLSRYTIQNGSLYSCIEMSLNRGEEVLEILYSKNGQLAIVFLGRFVMHAYTVEGWYVVNLYKGSWIRVGNKGRPTMEYEIPFTLSDDGQWASLTQFRRPVENTYKVDLFNTSLGLTVETMATDEQEDYGRFFNNNTWKPPYGRCSCVHRFVAGGEGEPTGLMWYTGFQESFLFSIKV